ncbi:MAG: hypothetical protein WA117_20955 [Verrucomicrobiia bacterium]
MNWIFALILSLAVAASAFAADSNSYNRITFRRGTEAQRPTVTFSNAEPAWVTDSKRLYIGDGVTAGGIPVAMAADLNAIVTNAFKQLAGSNWTLVIVNNLSNSVDARIINETNTLRIWATSLFAPAAGLDALGTNAFTQLANSNWTLTVVGNLSNTVDARIISETNTLRIWATSLFAPAADLNALGTNAFKQLAGSNWTLTLLNGYANLSTPNAFSANQFMPSLTLTNSYSNYWAELLINGTTYASGNAGETNISFDGTDVTGFLEVGQLIRVHGEEHILSVIDTDHGAVTEPWGNEFHADAVYTQAVAVISPPIIFPGGIQTIPFLGTAAQLNEIPGINSATLGGLSPAYFAESNWTFTIVNNLSNSVDGRIINETNTLRVWASERFALAGSTPAGLLTNASSATPDYLSVERNGSNVTFSVTPTHLTHVGSWLSGAGFFDPAGTAETLTLNLSNSMNIAIGSATSAVSAWADNRFQIVGGLGGFWNVNGTNFQMSNIVIDPSINTVLSGTTLTLSSPWSNLSGGTLVKTNIYIVAASTSTTIVGYINNEFRSANYQTLRMYGAGGGSIILDGRNSQGTSIDLVKPRSTSYANYLHFLDRYPNGLAYPGYGIRHEGTNYYTGMLCQGDLYIGTLKNDYTHLGGFTFYGTNRISATLPLNCLSGLVVYGTGQIVSLGSNAPSAVTGSSFLYTKMVDGTNNLYALDENGNETILSAHAGNRHVAKSINHYTGEGQVIDLLALAQAVEALTGKSSIVSAVTVPRRDWDADRAADEAVKVEKRNREISEWEGLKAAHDTPTTNSMTVAGLVVSYVSPANDNIVVGPKPEPYTADPKPKPQWLKEWEAQKAK